MSIDEILEEMDELLDKSSGVPFMSHRRVIDGERLRELINDVRLNLPQELKEAKKIEFDCQRIMNEAKSNAENIINRANERAVQIVSKEAIVIEARNKAVEMIKKAQQTSQNLQKTAVNSITKMLDETEASYNKNLQAIRAVKTKFSGSKIN